MLIHTRNSKSFICTAVRHRKRTSAKRVSMSRPYTIRKKGSKRVLYAVAGGEPSRVLLGTLPCNWGSSVEPTSCIQNPFGFNSRTLKGSVLALLTEGSKKNPSISRVPPQWQVGSTWEPFFLRVYYQLRMRWSLSCNSVNKRSCLQVWSLKLA